MADLEQKPNQYTARFKGFIGRSAMVALQRIAAEAENVPISDEARERAENVLSYTLQEGEAWTATRDLLLTMAPKMEMAGYREKWIEYLQAGVAQSQQQSDRLAEAELLFHCGYLYRLLSKYDQARQLLNASAQLYHSLGAAQNEARALNQLAYLAWQQHQPSEVTTLSHQALALLDTNDLERAMSLSALGLAAIEQYRWAEAEEYHRTALQIRTAHGNRRQMAWSQQNLGYALRGQSKYTEAISFYEEAIATLTELHDLANCAIAQMNLGIVYWAQGEPEKTMVMYTAAESTFRRLGDELNLAKVLTCIGLNFYTVKHWQQAETAFITSAALFHKLGDNSEYLNALDGLGISYLEQEFYSKALIIFEAIRIQLPKIMDTRVYPPLSKSIEFQLEQAKAGRAKMRGLV